MAEPAAEQLLQQLMAFNGSDTSTISDGMRVQLLDAVRSTGHKLENTAEATTRVLMIQSAESACVRIAAELSIFSKLGDETLTTKQIAKVTGAEEALLNRILRGLNAFGCVQASEQDGFRVSPSYALFRDPEFEKAFGEAQEILGKVHQGLPKHLAAQKYHNPQDTLNTTIQFVNGTEGQSFMDTLIKDPSYASMLHSFEVLMSAWAQGFSQLPELYPIKEKLIEGFDPETTMFVDVGGGLGQKSIALKKAIPDMPGRFVVQDTLRVVSSVPKDGPEYRGVEMMVHDFLTPQPITGARCYYIRQVMHDWPDADCLTILQQLKGALKPGYSRILIHELIVPEIGAGVWPVAQDFNMMCLFAVQERTEADWRRLCEQVGLIVTGIYLDSNPSREGIIEVSI